MYGKTRKEGKCATVSNFDGGSPIIPLRDGTEKKVEGREEDGESRDLFELTAHISGKVGELSGVKLRRREARLKGSENRLCILRLTEQGEKVQTDCEVGG